MAHPPIRSADLMSFGQVADAFTRLVAYGLSQTSLWREVDAENTSGRYV
jgi:hypothetical protein